MIRHSVAQVVLNLMYASEYNLTQTCCYSQADRDGDRIVASGVRLVDAGLFTTDYM